MRNKIWIDIDLIQELNLNLNEYLALLSLYYEKHNKKSLPFVYGGEIIEALYEKGWVMTSKNRLILKNRGTKLINRLNSNRGKLDIDINFVIKFRNKWRGLKLGSMGSLSSCQHKLNRWRNVNPGYSDEEILKAVDLYMLSLVNDYQYLLRADYFIFKREGKDENSRLSAFIDELEDNEIIDDEWTSNLN